MKFEQFLCNAVSRALGAKPNAVTMDTRLDCSQWSALAVGAFVTQLESEFSVGISVEDTETLARAASLREIAGTIHIALEKAEYIEHTVRHVRPNCRQLFLIYRGQFGAFAGMPAAFVRQTHIHNRNYILFRDERRRDYIRGVSASVPSFREFLNWQQAQRDEYFPHTDCTYCVGSASGAIAAVLSGYFLQVPIVWAFGLPTIQLQRDQMNYLDSMASTKKGADLKDLLLGSSPTTEYRLFYNEGFPAEREVAESLQNCPGVRLFPQPGDSPMVFADMLMNGSLAGLLEPYAEVPVGL